MAFVCGVGMLKKIKAWFREVTTPAHIRYFIVLPGEFKFPVVSINGLGLKEVPRVSFLNHKGLKYFVASEDIKRIKDEIILVPLAALARQDILDLIFHKKLLSDGELRKFNADPKKKIVRMY
jgi:hypothetical protein